MTCKNEGEKMYQLAEELFPICRSITGDGVRQTLRRIQEEIPNLKIEEVESNTSVFDWTIPKEWNIREAYIEDEFGNRIVDMKNSNLHVVGYSIPVDKVVSLQELQEHLYSLPEQPEWIPYVTSYYAERWGFCMTQRQRDSLKDIKYHVKIDSTLKDGYLTYGEVIIPGESEKEIFLSTYVCHPSMANNELSGPIVTTSIVKYLEKFHDRHYTYRIIFIPETIGAITYLSKNLCHMKKNVVAGYNITCVGDSKNFSYIPSRNGRTLADKVAKYVFEKKKIQYREYSFLDRGSDERQYNSPGVDLPVCCICRSKYHDYPEYHTSADNMNFISPEGLQGSYDYFKELINTLEMNQVYNDCCLCEPQLGKRGLYPTESFKGSATYVKAMMDFLAYCDGKNDLIDIEGIVGVELERLNDIAIKLMCAKLIERT